MYNDDKLQLETQTGIWMHSKKKWKIPDEGETGTIEDLDSGKVLAIASMTMIILLDKEDVDEKYYTWKRTKANDGWFRFESVRYGNEFLCAEKHKRIIIAGTNILCLMLITSESCSYKKAL